MVRTRASIVEQYRHLGFSFDLKTRWKLAVINMIKMTKKVKLTKKTKNYQYMPEQNHIIDIIYLEADHGSGSRYPVGKGDE